MTTLLLSSRHTEDNQALWRAALHAGWSFERVHGIHLPESFGEDYKLPTVWRLPD
jgi:hypothetical protein